MKFCKVIQYLKYGTQTQVITNHWTIKLAG